MLVNNIKKYNIKLISNNNVQLYPFITSAIRGAIGTELINRCCTHKSNIDCGNCTRLKTCSAGIMFASSNSKNASNITSPYIFYAPVRNRDNIDSINFDLTLLGSGLTVFKDIIEILDDGIFLTISKHKFTLDKLKVEQINNPKSIKNTTDSNNELVVNFISPYKYKATNQPLSFEYLVRGMLRRTLNIHKVCHEEFDMDYKDMINQAKNITTIDKNMTLINYDRYSNRTKTKMLVNGQKGYMKFTGNITPYIPLLNAAEIYHIGKLTTMGLGKIEIL